MTEIYWRSKEGNILVDDMTESHVKNVLKMLIRNNYINPPQPKTINLKTYLEHHIDDKWGHLYLDYLEDQDQEL